MTRVALRGLAKTFDGARTPVLERLDADVGDGELCVVVGPSGCGKSTLLRLVAGLEEVSAGEIHVGGRRVDALPPAERGVAMVFQSYALYPHMTVAENLAFGLKLAKTPAAEVARRTREAAERLQIEHLLERRPKALSGGQRQRVAIGRAIVREPRVFLFDEPLSNLDAALRVEMRLQIAALHRGSAASMIYVTHDQVEAMTLADRIVLLRAGPDVERLGSVAQAGPPLELYHRPVDTFVARFLGSPRMNLLAGTLARDENGRATVELAAGAGQITAAADATGLPAGARVHIGVRPEHASLAEPDRRGALAGQVMHLERLGDRTYVFVQIAGQDEPCVALASDGCATPIGERVGVTVSAERTHLFGPDARACARTADFVGGDA